MIIFMCKSYEHAIVITNRILVQGDFLEQMEKVIALHPHAVILREKDLPDEEYEKRAAEQQHLIRELPAKHPITLVVGAYEPERFYAVSRGLETVPEGGERCFRCYRLRLEAAAKMAAEGGFDYFATTLTISPLKNAGKLNEIGEELSQIYKVEHLPSDFKKKNGYRRSVELSAEYGLYRQNYCGCVFSKREQELREEP